MTNPNKPVFVFGSNLAGYHGGGAAADAMKYYGAIFGVGEGIQGNSYGIPTKDHSVVRSLSLAEVKNGVDRFLKFAKESTHLTFHITAIGCGLAGFTREQIIPLFKDAPTNCFFFEEVFGQKV